MSKIRKVVTSSLAVALLTAGVSVLPSEASAGDGGAIALGALGGLAAGAVIGNAVAAPRYYAPPPPPPPAYAYRAYAPVYRECVQRRVWGAWGWHWITEC